MTGKATSGLRRWRNSMMNRFFTSKLYRTLYELSQDEEKMAILSAAIIIVAYSVASDALPQ